MLMFFFTLSGPEAYSTEMIEMSKDESLVRKIQKGHINIKTSIYSFLKSLGFYYFNAKLFQTFILLIPLWSDSSL